MDGLTNLTDRTNRTDVTNRTDRTDLRFVYRRIVRGIVPRYWLLATRYRHPRIHDSAYLAFFANYERIDVKLVYLREIIHKL